ncbi:MAG TPA: family 10 glycosylhydrolase [Burkholderiaceae bacterium]
MFNRRTLIATAAASAALLSGCAQFGQTQLVSAPELAAAAPTAPREFRSAWVATVANIDWPSKRTLSSAEQQAEMRAMLDKAVELKFNAVILQIRTSADALYESKLEPWSEYLTGTQGKAPDPYYDPLALWIKEAHARGLELHAWFNPFRARQNNAKSADADNHLSKTHPQWVKAYGNQLWIDPGEIEAGEHTIAVVKDVLKRYDVDGLHIDDYFYPYPIALPGRPEGSTEELDFPDDNSWQRYLQAGGTLNRNDWRRQNVDRLIERVYGMIRATKPWVRFGVSPFGLGKPALRPEGISGFSQYDKLYANVELWLAEGWMDYLVPQLYWTRTHKGQEFEKLQNYWLSQNPKGRHLWPGMFTSRINDTPQSWAPGEIKAQIDITRKLANPGHAHFSMVALMQNRQGIADLLKSDTYQQAAFVPATPWLEQGAPGQATVSSEVQGDKLLLKPQAGAGKPAVRYGLWLRYGQQWRFEATSTTLAVPAAGLDAVVVSAVDRVGNEGPRAAYSLR